MEKQGRKERNSGRKGTLIKSETNLGKEDEVKETVPSKDKGGMLTLLAVNCTSEASSHASSEASIERSVVLSGVEFLNEFEDGIKP